MELFLTTRKKKIIDRLVHNTKGNIHRHFQCAAVMNVYEYIKAQTYSCLVWDLQRR